MVKHIGIVACSAEGAALCYKTICIEAQELMGEYCHPEITMHTHSFSSYMKAIYTSDWERVAALMLSSARKVASVGAEFAICPDNTIHEAYDRVMQDTPIPWLHIAEVVGLKARERGYNKLGILGTKYLMTSPVYPRALEKLQLSSMIPEKSDREWINKIIFKELVNDIFSEKSRVYFNDVIEWLKGEGCDAVVLGCTEIPLLVEPADCPLPVLDSTRLLARAAIKEAVNK